MRIPHTEHTSRPWRIHELARDFEIEDVWRLPVDGGPDDFPRFVEHFGNGPDEVRAPVVRFLLALRWRIGSLLGWDDRDPSTLPASLRERLPEDLRHGPTGPTLVAVPMRPLYLAEHEWATELVNGTCQAVMHLAWVPDGADPDGPHHAQMAVLVKPNGAFGRAYMALIKPFRYALVYPPLLRSWGRSWRAAVGPATGPARIS